MVIALLGDRCSFVEQKELLGTGHATLQAASYLRGKADAVTVTYGDMPLLTSETLQKLVDLFKQHKALSNPAIAMLTVTRSDSQGFGK